MTTADMPISFHRVAPGVYESDSARPPWVAEFRIHSTDHSRRGGSFPKHWHITHVPTGRDLSHEWGHNQMRYEFRLENAIERLNSKIAHALVDAFEVLATINAEAERKLADEQRRRADRAALESKIRRGIASAQAAWDLNEHSLATFVAAIADAISEDL